MLIVRLFLSIVLATVPGGLFALVAGAMNGSTLLGRGVPTAWVFWLVYVVSVVAFATAPSISRGISRLCHWCIYGSMLIPVAALLTTVAGGREDAAMAGLATTLGVFFIILAGAAGGILALFFWSLAMLFGDRAPGEFLRDIRLPSGMDDERALGIVTAALQERGMTVEARDTTSAVIKAGGVLFTMKVQGYPAVLRFTSGLSLVSMLVVAAGMMLWLVPGLVAFFVLMGYHSMWPLKRTAYRVIQDSIRKEGAQ